jgi:hypothetical protein
MPAEPQPCKWWKHVSRDFQELNKTPPSRDILHAAHAYGTYFPFDSSNEDNSNFVPYKKSVFVLSLWQ